MKAKAKRTAGKIEAVKAWGRDYGKLMPIAAAVRPVTDYGSAVRVVIIREADYRRLLAAARKK